MPVRIELLELRDKTPRRRFYIIDKREVGEAGACAVRIEERCEQHFPPASWEEK